MKRILNGILLCTLSLPAQTLEPYRESLPISEPSLRQADIMWAKEVYSMIDLRQRMNHPLYYPLQPHPSRYSLIQIIRSALESGTIRAFEDALFTKNISPEEALKRGSRTETHMLYDADPPYTAREQEIEFPIDLAEIQFIRIREYWVFDKQRSTLRYYLSALCPVVNKFDPNSGEFRGRMDLFWVSFEELSRVLRNYPFYNPQNSNSTLNYAQAMRKRLFHSVVYKEDNVFDRSISSYASGSDALLESQSVMEYIRRFESDLWEH
jgi:gliding motility associated protien GldN